MLPSAEETTWRNTPCLATIELLRSPSLLDTDGRLQKQNDRAKSFKTNNCTRSTRYKLARANAARRSLFANLPRQQAGHQALLRNHRLSNRQTRRLEMTVIPRRQTVPTHLNRQLSRTSRIELSSGGVWDRVAGHGSQITNHK